jgi:hypothetical protein
MLKLEGVSSKIFLTRWCAWIGKRVAVTVNGTNSNPIVDFFRGKMGISTRSPLFAAKRVYRVLAYSTGIAVEIYRESAKTECVASMLYLH